MFNVTQYTRIRSDFPVKIVPRLINLVLRVIGMNFDLALVSVC